MHTFRRIKDGDIYLFVVGFQQHSDESEDWYPLLDFTNSADAHAYVSYLNGGDHPAKNRGL